VMMWVSVYWYKAITSLKLWHQAIYKNWMCCCRCVTLMCGRYEYFNTHQFLWATSEIRHAITLHSALALLCYTLWASMRRLKAFGYSFLKVWCGNSQTGVGGPLCVRDECTEGPWRYEIKIVKVERTQCTVCTLS